MKRVRRVLIREIKMKRKKVRRMEMKMRRK